MYQRLSAHISSVDIPLDLSDLNWETARETAATIVVGKAGSRGGGSGGKEAAAKSLSSRSASTASTDSASQVRLRAASVKEEDEVMDQQEVPRETSVKDK